MNTSVKIILIAIIGIGLIGSILLFGNRNDNDTEPEPSSQQQNQDFDESEPGTSQPENTSSLNDDSSSTSQPGNTSSPSDVESEFASTVRYQNGQFTPQTITVQSGDVVKFINQGDGEMWIGSDEHPTHTQYAGTTVSEHCQDGDETSRAFDQCSVGETYTFTFEKTGEWNYHNHVNASAGGTIIVE